MKWVELEELQKAPLRQKVDLAWEVLARAFEVAARPALAFSGGKDSTVLLDLVRRFFPERMGLVVIYGNTGVEYPECVRFARRLAREWALDFHEARPGVTEQEGLKYEGQRRVWEWLRGERRLGEVLKADGKLKSTLALERACPADLRGELERERLVWKAGTRMGYWWCVDQYGWPLLGKSWSKLSARRINVDTFLRMSESQSEDPKLLAYYEVLRKAKISQHCCNVLKKEPAERVQEALRVDLIFKGLMASESRTRAINFLTRGHLFEGAERKYLDGRPFYHCQPMATWTDADVWEYIRHYEVQYASLYDMTFMARDGSTQRVKRNGCMGCATDLQFEDNHLFVLRQTHPRAWRALMRGGMGVEIQNLQRVLRGDGQLTLMDLFSVDELVEMQPCVFDDLDGRGGLVRPAGGLVYDSEDIG